MPVSNISITGLFGLLVEGLASADASEAILGSGIIDINPNVEFTGSTANVALGSALAAPDAVGFLSTTRVAAQNLADDVLSSTVYKQPLSIRVPRAYMKLWEANRIPAIGAETLEGFLANTMRAQLIYRFRKAVIDALDALSGGTVVLDVSGRSGTLAGLTVASEALATIQELLALFGDADTALHAWIGNSKIARDLSLLTNTAGIPYYPKKNGRLHVEDLPWYKLDSGTTQGSTTYDTYIAKKNAVSILCNLTPDALESQLNPIEVAQAADLPAGWQYDLEIDYTVVVPAKYRGTDKPGVLKLISK